jgi:hypothetical protein
LPPNSADVPRALSPLVWLLAVLWLTVRILGRAAGRILWTYETALSTIGNAAALLTKAALLKLGPLGRLLQALLLPPLRGLRWLWRRAGTHAFAALRRYAQWIDRSIARRVVTTATQWLRYGALRLRPMLRQLETWMQPIVHVAQVIAGAVKQAAAGLSSKLRRAWAPVKGAATRIRRVDQR